MKKYPKLTAAVIACLVCIVATAAVCLLALRSNESQYAKYDEIRSIIQERYVGEVDEAATEDTVARAMIDSLGDPWSYYMSAEEYAEYQRFVSNQYIGVGITVELPNEDSYPVIAFVTDNSPASEAGLEAGYAIMAIDGRDLRSTLPADLKEEILSYGDNSFTLTVMNEDGATRDAELRCELVFTPPVFPKMLADDIGYIQITNFEEGCAQGVKDAVDDLTEQGAVALIFDVRDNPGGRVSELIEALDYLLPKGDLFISRSRDGEEKVYTSDSSCIDLPMAVLINGNSYSAAEFFAAVLREYGVATLVGEPTTGKGRSQTTVELSDGSAVHISNNTYYTPSGVDLSEAGGVEPDIVSHPVEEGTLDVQLRAAVNALS